MPEFDVVIRGGTIVDGTQAPRYRADLGIKNGRIAEIGHIDSERGSSVLDANGCVVAPGFIDLHTHYDAQIFWDPYCSISGWHGVTSVVIGNCGFGFAPCAPDQRERAMLSMTRVEAIPLAAMQAAMPWDWETYPEFLDSIDRIPKAVNVMAYMPLGPVLLEVLGWDDSKSGREPTGDEMQRLKSLLNEGMEAGAVGWSAQVTPPLGGQASQRDFDGTPMPTDMMSKDTMLKFAEVLRERNEGFMMLTLVTGSAKDDWQTFEDLAETAGRPMIYNSVLTNDDHPNRHRRQLAWLENCREKGVRVYCQAGTIGFFVIFSFEDWNLFDDSDDWADATCGTMEEKIEKLSDPARREGLRQGSEQVQRGQTVTSFKDIVVMKPIAPELQHYKDMTLGEIAEAQGCHVVDAMLDIAVADKLQTQFYFEPVQSDDLLRELVTYPYAIFGVSDGGAHTKFFTGGRYPTESIIKFVRDKKMIDLERIHWGLSGFPAYCTGMTDRGTLQLGNAADIVVYDLEKLELLPSEVAHDLPGGEWRRIQRAKGYRYILVNGQVTIEDDKESGVTPGFLLRGGKTPISD